MLPILVLAIFLLVLVPLFVYWSISRLLKGWNDQEWDDTDFIEVPDSRAVHPSQGKQSIPEPEPISDEEFESEVAILLAPPVVQATWTHEEVEAIHQCLGDDPETHRQVQEVLSAIEEMGPESEPSEAPVVAEAAIEEAPVPMVWKKWNK